MMLRRDKSNPRDPIQRPSLEMFVLPDTKPAQLQETHDEKGTEALTYYYSACHPIGMKDQLANIAASAG
jgi:hypothetical protein